MQVKASQAQNIDSNEIFYNEIILESRQNLLSKYLEKITSNDVAKFKIYLGIAYFVMVTILSVSLLF
jgi:hypothetical protein